VQPQPFDPGAQPPQPTAGAGPGDGGTSTLRKVGYGCAVFAALTICGNGLTFVLLATKVLKHMFHIRMATAQATAVGSIAGIVVGVLGLIVAIVMIVVGKKKA
jgi:hypothetical protein